jgi:hypothetical protein
MALVMAIPIRLLWNLQITLMEKVSVGIAFVFGFITITAASMCLLESLLSYSERIRELFSLSALYREYFFELLNPAQLYLVF